MIEISIIVPCYNVEEYIDFCVRSLVEQTLGLENMELIFVDDASQDDTLEHLKAWEQKYPEYILVVACEKNGKQGTARNIGMQYATGEYIAFVDSDDWVEPDMYEKMLSKAKIHHCDMVSCHLYRNLPSGHQNPDTLKEEDCYYSCELSTVEGGGWPWVFMGSVVSRIYRREILFENHILFPEGLVYEDNYFAAVVALYCKSIYQIQECLYHYRDNRSSTTQSRNQERHFDRLEIELLKVKMYQELGIGDRFHDEIELQFMELYYFNTMFLMATRFDVPPYSVFLRMKKDIEKYFPDFRQNPLIQKENNPIWNLLTKLLFMKLDEETFLYIMKKYRALPR